MNKVYQLNSEWKDASGWNVICADIVGKPYPKWHIPAKVLGISLTEYILLIKNEYGATITIYNQEKQYLGYYWKSQKDMRRFKNMINTTARKINFTIGD